MIPKVHHRGISLDWLLPYLFSPNGGQHHDPRVIAAWTYATSGDLTELQPPAGATGRPAVRHLMNLLEQPVRAGINPPTKYVWHCSVHNHASDPLLSDQQWQHVATEIVAEVGLAPAGDPNAVRWIAVRHATNHIHILATLVRQDGRTAWTRQDYRQTHTACRRLERHYGLRQVGTRPPTTVRPKPRELWKANREHRNEVPRDRLRREVRAVAATVDNQQGFFEQLRSAGLLLRVRTTNTVTGYAVALPDHRNAAGRTIWYSGARLARDLSLCKLHHRWRSES